MIRAVLFDCDGTLVVPGAAPAIRACAERVMVAVVSSSTPRAGVERLLATLGVREVVHAIVGAEDVLRPPPDPALLLEAAARCYADPRHCVVVAAGQAVLVAARAAGMHTRLVLDRCAEPELCRPLADEAFTQFATLPRRFGVTCSPTPTERRRVRHSFTPDDRSRTAKSVIAAAAATAIASTSHNTL